MAAVAQGTIGRRQDSRPVWLATLALGLVLGIAGTMAIAQVETPVTSNPDGVISGTTTNAYLTYQEAVADLTAALTRHDGPAIARYQAAVTSQMTAEVIEAMYADRQRLLANLGAAEARNDHRLIQHFKAQLAALCPPIENGSSPSFCQ